MKVGTKDELAKELRGNPGTVFAVNDSGWLLLAAAIRTEDVGGLVVILGKDDETSDVRFAVFPHDYIKTVAA